MDIDNEQIGGMPNPAQSCAQNTGSLNESIFYDLK
jgi:hypothetical protein